MQALLAAGFGSGGFVRMPVNTKTFREACCERFGIPFAAYEEEVFWHCFYRRRLCLGRLFWRLVNRTWFDADLEVIRSVADCTTVSDLRTELNNCRYQNPVAGFWRKVLRVRLSGTRLLQLGAEVLERTPPPRANPS